MDIIALHIIFWIFAIIATVGLGCIIGCSLCSDDEAKNFGDGGMLGIGVTFSIFVVLSTGTMIWDKGYSEEYHHRVANIEKVKIDTSYTMTNGKVDTTYTMYYTVKEKE